MTHPSTHAAIDPTRLRRVVATVAALNFTYFFVELTVALAIGSVSLFADSVDFLEDTAVSLLVLIALGWTLRRRALAGRAMALILLVPAAAAAWEAIGKVSNPEPPAALSLILTAGGAAVVNGYCAWLLARVRHQGGSLSHAAYLSARNDVAINLAIIAMGLLTAATRSGWPDLILGAVIIVLNLTAAKEVWELATEEHLAAKALAGEDLD